MTPLLIAGLAGIGERIVSKVMDSGKTDPSAASFESHMSSASATNNITELGAFLKARGVTNFKELNALEKQLSAELQDHPELAEKLSSLPPGTPLTLKVNEGNILTLEGPDGTLAELPAESESGKLAMKLHQVKSIQSQHSEVPGATLSQLVKDNETKPTLNASWMLLKPKASEIAANDKQATQDNNIFLNSSREVRKAS